MYQMRCNVELFGGSPQWKVVGMIINRRSEWAAPGWVGVATWIGVYFSELLKNNSCSAVRDFYIAHAKYLSEDCFPCQGRRYSAQTCTMTWCAFISVSIISSIRGSGQLALWVHLWSRVIVSYSSSFSFRAVRDVSYALENVVCISLSLSLPLCIHI